MDACSTHRFCLSRILALGYHHRMSVSGRKPQTIVASSERVSHQMSKLGQRDTGPEIAIRSELHRRGLRFRVHAKPEEDLATKADILFRPIRVCVYVDGCFWHSCPEHGTMPRNNREFWKDKLRRNTERDAQNTRILAGRGWTVIRCWEHEDPVDVSHYIEAAVRSPATR